MAKPGLSDDQRVRVIEMRQANPKLRYKDLAAMFGFSTTCIAHAITGRATKRLPLDAPKRRPVPPPNVMPGITLAQLTARR